MNQQQIVQIQIPKDQGLSFLGIPFTQIAIGIVVIFIFVYMSLIKKKKTKKDIVGLIGQRFSGKTQLFISLGEGKRMPTIPSIKKNETSYKLNEKVYRLIDYNGDNLSKEEILNQMNSVHTIIHVIDGTSQKSFGDAAMFIYRVLVNKNYQKDNCNFVIFLNKQDSTGFIGKERAQKMLQDEIEHIKAARIHEGEQSENEQDYIKLSKNRFKLPFKIIVGSAEQNTKELDLVLSNL